MAAKIKFKFKFQNLTLLILLLLTACNAATPTANPPLSPPAGKATIKIGGIFDLSGTSSVEGREYAAGVEAQIAWFNAQGGAGGYKVELVAGDYGFKAPQAIELYQKIQAQGAVAFIGWTTADTLAITRQLNSGKTPLLSASYADSLIKDVKANPYNFFIAPSYADQMLMAIQWARVNHPEPYLPDRRLGLAYIFSDDALGREPLQPGREYAAAQKLFWYHEGVLKPEIDAANIEFEMKRLKAAQPDFAFIQANDKLTAETLKTARRSGVANRFVGLNYSGGPDLLTLAGSSAEGLVVTQVIAYPDSSVPGMAALQKWVAERPAVAPLNLVSLDKQSANAVTLPNKITLEFVQGWVTTQVLLEGIRQAVTNQTQNNPNALLSIDGDAVKAGLESLKNYDTGGLTAPVSFSAENHKGVNQLRFMQVQNGRWQPITGFVSLPELEAMPYKNQAPPPTATPIIAPVPTNTPVVVATPPRR